MEAMYRDLWRIRRFEEHAQALFTKGAVKGTAHSCVGQEGIAVGACAALRDTDTVVTHHRGHGHCIAKGADTAAMMAELFGRETGYGHGLGGSMHIAALDRGVLGANGIVGAGLGIGTGAGLAAQVLKDGRVCVAFFGDGAANEGLFHESLNLAAAWKLPVVFLCENNRYGLSLGIAEASGQPRIARRADGYGMPGVTVDGADVLALAEVVGAAAARARAGGGPTLIEAMTYRWGDHSMRTNLPRYRPEAEEAEARASGDPVARLGAVLAGRQVGEGRLAALRDEAEREIVAGIAAAESAAEPGIGVLDAAVAAPHAAGEEPPPGTRAISYVEAIREALDGELARDPRVILMGQDVGRIGGLFGCSKGLQARHGRERVRDTPISENVLVNAAVGAALTGLRPVVEVQFADFLTHMMDGLVNQAAKLRFMLGGEATVPLVVRGPQGGGIRLGAQHSQSLEVWFAHVPGLVVLAPSCPYDAKGLLAAAIRDDNPVLLLEHKLLYSAAGPGPVPEQPYALPIGKAAIRRPGTDVTVVATLAMVDAALAAARDLAREGIEAEVVDPRTLRPLDMETILASVRKTNRCVVAHEGWKAHGYGAEIAARLMEEAFDHLDAPVERVGMRGVPMPYNDKLERQVIPGAGDIRAAARRACYAAGH